MKNAIPGLKFYFSRSNSPNFKKLLSQLFSDYRRDCYGNYKLTSSKSLEFEQIKTGSVI